MALSFLRIKRALARLPLVNAPVTAKKIRKRRRREVYKDTPVLYINKRVNFRRRRSIAGTQVLPEGPPVKDTSDQEQEGKPGRKRDAAERVNEKPTNVAFQGG